MGARTARGRARRGGAHGVGERTAGGSARRGGAHGVGEHVSRSKQGGTLFPRAVPSRELTASPHAHIAAHAPHAAAATPSPQVKRMEGNGSMARKW